MERKRLVILGSTGSVGRQTLEIVRAFPDIFDVIGLAADKNTSLLMTQIDEFKPRMVFSASYPSLFDTETHLISTEPDKMVTDQSTDIVMVSTTGKAGLCPTVSALQAGKRVCLANKEVIIMAGSLITKLAKANGELLPVDSEPNAIWQCIHGEAANPQRVIITASGGPFRGVPNDSLHNVTPEQALKHPTWNMGPRITIDSSTLMNKGFEVIEAKWLFNVDWSQIEVVVHPQSIIHSMVEFDDGSIKAQMAMPDMKLPIQYALLFPARRFNKEIPRLDLSKQSKMTFEPLHEDLYPCYKHAIKAGRMGKTYPVVLSASDEIAVNLFLNRQLRFTDIPKVIEMSLETHIPSEGTDLEEILQVDMLARSKALEIAKRFMK